MELNKELEEKIVYILAKTYMRVDWKKMGKRSAYDVFQHRLKVASYRGNNIKTFLEKLCHGLSLQSISVDPQIIEELENRKEEVMEALRTESVYLTLKAAKQSKKIRKEKEG